MSSATVDTVIEMQNMEGEKENDSSTDQPNPQLRVKGASNQNLFNRLSQQCGNKPCGFTFKSISELEKYVNDDSNSAEMEQKYGKTQEDLKEFCKTLTEVAHVKEKGTVTCEEWLNWIKLDQTEDTKNKRKNFLRTHSTYQEWEDLFFKLSNGSMEINTNKLEKYIKDTDDIELREEFKLKKGILKNYVKLVKESDYDENGTVTLNEWMAWITQRKQEYDRKNWLLKPWKSFIVIVSLIQFIIGVADRIEKYYRCYDYQFKGHSTCPFIRPFHDAMIFKSCLRFEAWRYVTHAFVHHGLPHLATNLGLQLFFGALLESIQHGRNPRLRVGILYFSSVVFSIVAASFPIHQEIEGASAGVFGLMGGHVAYMLLNFKEECRFNRESITLKRLLEPFNPVMNFTLIIVYLIMELSFFAVDEEEKICFLGHLFGFLSGFIVGFIVLDNRKEEPWENITGRVLISAYIMVFLCMVVLHMGEFSIVDTRCMDCKKAVHNILNMTDFSQHQGEWTNCGKGGFKPH